MEYFIRVDEMGEAGLGKENLAGNHLNIANTYNRMGNRREAIRYSYKALSVFESVQNIKGMSYCYNNLGLLLKLQSNFVEAETYLKKSLEMKEHEGDTKGIANSCNELALLYTEKKELDKAILHVDRTIMLSESLGSQELLATALINKGKILRFQGEFETAARHFERARPLAEVSPNQYLLAGLLTETGGLFYETKNPRAIPVLLSGIDAAQKSSNVDALVNAHLLLSQAYAVNNQYREALDQFQKYHELEDSVSGAKLKLDYKALETQYEVEKKNAEIDLLKKDAEIQASIVQQQRAIQIGIAIAFVSAIVVSGVLINRYRVVNRTKRQLEIERVRNTIARDLHDDIGSTLSSINIVSQMAIRRKESDGIAVENHFKNIFVHSSQIMERMSDIVWSIDPANDSVLMTVSKMKEFAAELLEPAGISYSFHGTESLTFQALGIEKRKNIFLIYKEAINNAAKYSKATFINITLAQQRESLIMEVVDNGNGFNLSTCRTGNGLQNMAERAKGINGTVHFESKPGEGSSIFLQVPLT